MKKGGGWVKRLNTLLHNSKKKEFRKINEKIYVSGIAFYPYLTVQHIRFYFREMSVIV